MNRKAQLGFIKLIVFLVITFLGAFIGYKILHDFINDFGDYDTLPADSQNVLNNAGKAYTWLDYVSLLLIGIYGVFLIGSGMVARQNPAFFMISLFILIPVMLASMSVADYFQELEATPEYSDYVNKFPLTFSIGTNLPKVLMGFSALQLVALYVSTRV